MRRVRGRASRRPLWTAESLAGWVFADLLLVMFLVGVGTEVTRTQASTNPQSTINTLQDELDKANAKVKAQKAKIDKLSKKGMAEVPICVNVKVNPQRLLASDAKYDKALSKKLATELSEYKDELAGMVLIWGLARDPDTGIRLADQTRAPLTKALPGAFQGAALRTLWKGGPPGTIKLEMYFFGNVKGEPCK